MGLGQLSSSQQHALLIAAQFCATLSLIGSLFILLCYAKFPHLRKLSFTLVAWLAVADVGSDFTYYMGNPEERSTCVAQGALQQFFQMSQILWTVAIATVLHDVTVNQRMYHPQDQKKLMRRFHIAVWGASLLSMVLPFFTDSYGSTGAWCWIEASDTSGIDIGTVWRYLVLYIPLWVAILYNIAVYIEIARVVRRFSIRIDGEAGGGSVGPSVEQQRRMNKFVERLVWYPVVLVACWTFATINRIQNAADPDNPIFVLFLLHTSLVAVTGLLNAIVYGSTDAVRVAVSEVPFVQWCFGRIRRGSRGRGTASNAGLASDVAADGVLDPEDEGPVEGIALSVKKGSSATTDNMHETERNDHMDDGWESGTHRTGSYGERVRSRISDANANAREGNEDVEVDLDNYSAGSISI